MTDNVGMHPGASESDTSPNAHYSGAVSGNYTNSSLESSDARGWIPTGGRPFPKRKNIRAEFHDYSGGDYFVTICTRDKEHYFGKIINGEMQFSIIGEYANNALETLHTHYSYLEVPLFVVMPNHVHAIISIRAKADAPEIGKSTDAPGCIPTVRTALGVVVGGFKQAVTRYARRNNINFGWQSRYHDHIIRGTRDGNMITEYIENNVARWANDCFYK